MTVVGLGKRVQIFISEDDRVGGRSLATTLLEHLRKEGAAGAIVTRGVAGFGTHGRLRTASLADLVSPLPLVVTWIDTPDRVDRLLPSVAGLVREGLITVEDVSIVQYSHRQLDALTASLRVADVMTTEVVTTGPETSLPAVVELVIGRTFRAVPIIGEEGLLVGIVTNTDLTERGGLPARIELLAALDPESRRELLQPLSERRAADVMTLTPIAIRPASPLQQAIALMLEYRVKRLPVVEAAGRLVGIVSRTDVLGAMGTAYPAPVEAEPGDALVTVGAQAGPPTETGRPPLTLQDLLGRHVPVVREDARLAEVLDVVVSTRLNRAVVIDGQGHVRGVVSDGDVLQRLDPRARQSILEVLMGRGRLVHASAARTTAAELMSPAAPVAPSMTIEAAARLMIEGRHKILPVVDDQGVLIGMVDRSHLLAQAAP
jgi:CBS domain-containing protein